MEKWKSDLSGEGFQNPSQFYLITSVFFPYYIATWKISLRQFFYTDIEWADLCWCIKCLPLKAPKETVEPAKLFENLQDLRELTQWVKLSIFFEWQRVDSKLCCSRLQRWFSGTFLEISPVYFGTKQQGDVVQFIITLATPPSSNPEISSRNDLFPSMKLVNIKQPHLS